MALSNVLTKQKKNHTNLIDWNSDSYSTNDILRFVDKKLLIAVGGLRDLSISVKDREQLAHILKNMYYSKIALSRKQLVNV